MTLLPVPNSETLSFRSCQLCKKAFRGAGEFCCSGCETVDRLLRSGVQGGSCEPMSNRGLSKIESEKAQVQLYIEGIHCSSCLWILERLPHWFPESVERATLQLSKSVLDLHLLPEAKLSDVVLKIEALGYRAHLLDGTHQVAELAEKEGRRQLVEIGVAGALAGNVMLMSIPLYSGIEGGLQSLFEWLSLALAIPSVFYSGRSFFTNVAAGIRSRTFPIDGPILLAILVAFFYSAVSVLQGTHELYFDSLTTLVFLLLSSRYYLSRLRQSSKSSLGVLDFFRAVSPAKKGEMLALKAGVRLECDGVLRSGSAFVDLSHFNGESVPSRVDAGGVLYAGCEVMEASADARMEVTAIGEETRMARMLTQVREAQTHRSPSELMSDQWAKKLLAVVSAVAALAMGYFIWTGQTQEGLRRVLALLIVTCPCALALATPLVFAMALKRLVRQGVLIKEPEALDRALLVKKIYFDKTGTLTWGRLTVLADVQSWSPEVVAPLYAMVMRSRHPVSRAIEAAIQNSGVSQRSPEHSPYSVFSSFEEIPGLGLRARVQNLDLEYRLEREPSNPSQDTVVSFTRIKEGKATRLLFIALRDQVRPTSAEAITKLKNMGFQVALLSGDNHGAASEVARQLGIDEVYSEQTPESKSRRVRKSMMVGDGLNDALALSRAHVSVAVQGGMDAAIQSAQVYSLVPGVQTIPTLMVMAAKVRRVLWQNFAFSTSYNVLGATLALTGVMSPLIAAILMPLSATTVFVATLFRFRAGAES